MYVLLVYITLSLLDNKLLTRILMEAMRRVMPTDTLVWVDGVVPPGVAEPV